MAKAKDEDLIWQDIDTENLSRGTRRAYDEYKTASRLAAAKREEFENIALTQLAKSGAIPDGQEAVFSYRFGKLAVAFRPATAKRAKTAKGPAIRL